MIIKMICAPFFLLVDGLIAMLPVLNYIPSSIADTTTLLLKAMQFFPNDVWVMTLGSIVFWLTVHLIIGLVKFILSWIPIVNMGS